MKSIDLPFNFSNGRLSVVTDYAAVIEQKILDVLLTSSAERVMRPRYGASVYSLLFEIMDPNVWADFRAEAMMDINESVDGVTINDIRMSIDDNGGDSGYDTVLSITVMYTIPPDKTNTLSFSVSQGF